MSKIQLSSETKAPSFLRAWYAVGIPCFVLALTFAEAISLVHTDCLASQHHLLV